jgi:hypothetical protein
LNDQVSDQRLGRIVIKNKEIAMRKWRRVVAGGGLAVAAVVAVVVAAGSAANAQPAGVHPAVATKVRVDESWTVAANKRVVLAFVQDASTVTTATMRLHI